MSFVHPTIVFVVMPIAVAVLTLAFVLDLARRRRALERLGEQPLIGAMAASLSRGRLVWRMILFIVGVGLVLTAAAQPQMPGKVRLRKSRGLDIVVALDFSKSMLATDIYPSRIERAKRELERLLDQLSGDRIGLVAFAGEAVSYPLTSDYAAAKLFWRELSPQQMPVGGTAIGKALTQATDLLKRVRPASNAYAQVILLLTDGEDHESDPIAAAKEAQKLGIRVYAIGIGSRSGELVPDPEASPGGARYLKDQKGGYVTSKLDEDVLQKVVRLTDGEYFRVDPKQFGVERVIQTLATLKRGEAATRLVTEPIELYLAFLVPGFLLLLIETVLSDRRRRAAAVGRAS
ncbi:MAG TPA: VWA domain-containing protein [Polyangia bacterium]|jgi:Ca-activated chloride channel family protein